MSTLTPDEDTADEPTDLSRSGAPRGRRGVHRVAEVGDRARELGAEELGRIGQREAEVALGAVVVDPPRVLAEERVAGERRSGRAQPEAHLGHTPPAGEPDNGGST